MRLIDADALTKWVQECGEKCPTLSVEKLFNTIKDAPTVDAVPVVRCKDCKHRYHSVECPCQSYDHFYSWMPADDWFCKKGKRKE